MGSLCQGIPVIVSPYFSKLLHSDDGGKTFKRDSRTVDLSQHPMLLIGFRYFNGKPTFVTRNSWSKGNAAEPQKSQALIPFSQVCRLVGELVLLRNKNETNPWGEKFCGADSAGENNGYCRNVQFRGP
jgi:hypothetical protein